MVTEFASKCAAHDSFPPKDAAAELTFHPVPLLRSTPSMVTTYEPTDRLSRRRSSKRFFSNLSSNRYHPDLIDPPSHYRDSVSRVDAGVSVLPT